MPLNESVVPNIINEARKCLAELPWIEFKENYYDPQLIGEYISALSNTAALYEKQHGFLIWGVKDTTHEIVNTDFNPQTKKVGNQGLVLWLATQLEPKVQIYFYPTQIEGKNVVLLEVEAANRVPVKFKGVPYIRIDSNKKKLQDFPDTERQLWAALSKYSFESMNAMEFIDGDMVLKLIDYPSYFDLLSLDLPSNKDAILASLTNEGIIVQSESGNYNITNFGAILFAKKLSNFPNLSRKAVRVIKYTGNNRMLSASQEIVIDTGYASSFEKLIIHIGGLVPVNEVLGAALRKNVSMYPELAIRELIANAIIHQDFFSKGTSPMVEIFDDRMEVTNPGTPLIDKNRFVDHPPVSRNEKIASFMRRIGVCEERGSGYDKIVFQTEFFQLPAPEIDIYDNNTKVSLFAYKPFSKMDKNDRQRACYLHACLKRVNREFMTNSSLRERFKIDAKNSSMISRLLNDTCASGLIKVSEDSTSDKNRKYLPFWA